MKAAVWLFLAAIAVILAWPGDDGPDPRNPVDKAREAGL